MPSWLNSPKILKPNRCKALVRALSLASALTLLVSCATENSIRGSGRVLLVGNSIVYTNNLPAIFTEIANAQPGARAYRVDMFARGGASLTELAADRHLLQALRSRRYDAVVLQERGGDDLCLQTEDRDTADCRNLVVSRLYLARLAHKSGARVLYLGTYQMSIPASEALVRAEKALSERMGARYVEISEVLRRSRENHPDLPWIHADKGHPGIATTVLMADRLYESLTGRAVHPTELCTSIALYEPMWKREGLVQHEELVASTPVRRCLLAQDQMRIISLAGASFIH